MASRGRLAWLVDRVKQVHQVSLDQLVAQGQLALDLAMAMGQLGMALVESVCYGPLGELGR